MDSKTGVAALADCIAPLDDEDRRALRAYWEQVIREESIPPVRRVPSPVPSALERRRERREARRAVARIATASRVLAMSPVVSGTGRVRRPMSEWAAAGCGSTGPEAA
jgi:hypothetical protein